MFITEKILDYSHYALMGQGGDGRKQSRKGGGEAFHMDVGESSQLRAMMGRVMIIIMITERNPLR